jgi:plasmid stability protein
MGVLIQIRNVPEEVHRTLKARAALKGISLSEYVRRMLIADASRPTPEELEARIRARGPMPGDWDSAEIIREIRGPIPPID